MRAASSSMFAGLAVAAGGGVDAKVADGRGLAEEGVIVELDTGVEGDPTAVGRAGEGVDLGEEQVVFGEETPEAGENAREFDKFASREAEGDDGFLEAEVLGGGEGGEGQAHRGGRLTLDAYATGEGGDSGGATGPVVIDDAEVALGLDRQGLLDEEAGDGLAGNTRGEDGAGRLLDLGGAFGEADGAGPGASAGADLPLDDDAGAELRRGQNSLGGSLSEQAARRLKAGTPEERLGLMLEEAHETRGSG